MENCQNVETNDGDQGFFFVKVKRCEKKQMMEIKDFFFVKVKRCGKKQMMEIKDFFFVKVKRCGNR